MTFNSGSSFKTCQTADVKRFSFMQLAGSSQVSDAEHEDKTNSKSSEPSPLTTEKRPLASLT